MQSTHLMRSVPGLLVIGLLAATGCRSEVGVNERHVQGFLEIPPLLLVESEVYPLPLVEEEAVGTNNTVETAEIADAMGYRYTEVSGRLDGAGSTGFGSDRTYTGDVDAYRFVFGVDGEVTISLDWPEDADESDLDILLYDGQGTLLAREDDSLGRPSLTREGCVDDELVVLIAAKGLEEDHEEGAYTLTVNGFDPNEQESPILVGAYLSDGEDSGEEPATDLIEWESSALGDPVAGSSAGDFTFDEESRTWWAPFDLPFPQQLVTLSGLLVEGIGYDLKDNDCDGFADDGLATEDTDGDGFSPAEGDCNDTDPEVFPQEGDRYGDRIDNNCDGFPDNGPDPDDADGDGFSAAEGDCNDTDPAIFPSSETQLLVEIPYNLIDDDCNGEVDENPPEDCENEEDDDEDEAIDCEDEDCDGFEGCGGPAPTEDHDGDGFSVQGGDCNDTDPGIHPHTRDDANAIIERHWDIPNRIDDDCDQVIDENYLWDLVDGEYVENPTYYADEDGDGFSMFDRDCNDADDTMFPGNYELEAVHQVSGDLERVHLLAGNFADLNTTTPSAGSLVNSQLRQLDLSAERPSWSWVDEWFGSRPGAVEPVGLPVITLDVFVPTVYGIRVDEQEPNEDAFANPQDAQALGTMSAAPLIDRVDGEISSIVPGGSDGDNDWYTFTTPETGFVNLELNWGECDPDADPEDTQFAGADDDFDAILFCWFGNDFNPFAWYAIDGNGAATLARPEVSRTVVELPAGTDCRLQVFGYAGTPGPYSVKIWLD